MAKMASAMAVAISSSEASHDTPLDENSDDDNDDDDYYYCVSSMGQNDSTSSGSAMPISETPPAARPGEAPIPRDALDLNPARQPLERSPVAGAVQPRTLAGGHS